MPTREYMCIYIYIIGAIYYTLEVCMYGIPYTISYITCVYMLHMCPEAATVAVDCCRVVHVSWLTAEHCLRSSKELPTCSDCVFRMWPSSSQRGSVKLTSRASTLPRKKSKLSDFKHTSLPLARAGEVGTKEYEARELLQCFAQGHS